ncbi:5-methylcytosine-specific restriction endonuclease McrBC, GTP-binding regulatory subunit McrB [Chitinophaga rupis]|uniref:5-methylcytosine-specific restriction endonuclease McrBC, GTP-binding regulatory subunit McrB n=1 Tax=Chitinophaga rupis TaxID=573321 RepID=A0A1H7JCF1_9BACT|nr:AAA family ATPase [Chitinophaga rupis]SEK72319.1 5-methylcytosine-specific restriction endonuclease McrBC, GTP-binding regulatory subunit McrB [Chitinophaga rupis]
MNFFVFTAANAEAQKHFKDTVEKSVDIQVLKKHLTSDQFDQLLKRSTIEGFYCWGSRPGPDNESNWKEMKEGDPIMSYWAFKYHHIAQIIYKIRNKDLAKELWGEDDEGKTWEYIYFFSKPESIDPPLSSVETKEYLRGSYRGFTRIAKNKTERVLQEFGSLENFIANYTGTKKAITIPSKINMLSEETIEHVYKYIKGVGLQYQREDIVNFYLSLRTKPFVILAGVSGTGKTQLPRKFAAALGLQANVIQIPVRPDWTDGSELLGYTSLDGNFIAKELVLTIKEATKGDNIKKPYFFILDEMNLARVEHYFSDFLSIIETREWADEQKNSIVTDPLIRKEVLVNAKNKNEFESLLWPDNLYLIGTVNMDETTHTFSRKVLDRANTIEMNSIDLDWSKLSDDDGPEEVSDIQNDVFRAPYLRAIDLAKDDRDSINDKIKLLIEINEKLQHVGLHFAYRVRDEIAFYLINNKKNKLIEDNVAFDFQIMQKILPRIHGSSEGIQTLLIELLNILEGQKIKTENFEFTLFLKEFNKREKLNYPRSSKKIVFMLKRYDEDRFTSFWI